LGCSSGRGGGIRTPQNAGGFGRRLSTPGIVDAGVGTASDVSVAFELGAPAVLLNPGIALARDPVRMATAMKHAALAGRAAFLAGRIERRRLASPSSPEQGKVTK